MIRNRPAWLEYVTALLDTPAGSPAHEIGTRVWELSTAEDIYVYLTDVMADNAPNTRAFEVAWDVWALLWGVPA